MLFILDHQCLYRFTKTLRELEARYYIRGRLIMVPKNIWLQTTDTDCKKSSIANMFATVSAVNADIAIDSCPKIGMLQL